MQLGQGAVGAPHCAEERRLRAFRVFTKLTWKKTAAMARKLAVLGLAALIGTAAGASVTLTKDNFETEVFDSGKHAFIKFQAPWSVACCALPFAAHSCH